MTFQHEAKRNAAIIAAIMDRIKWLEKYTSENEFHRGMRSAALMLRYEINRARQVNPKTPND